LLKIKREKYFSCNILILSLNNVVIWLILFCFNDKNWVSIVNNWLSNLVHFANHHIDLNASLNLCIYNLKYACFACWMILFLWLLCLRYSCHALNVLCDFHMILQTSWLHYYLWVVWISEISCLNWWLC